MTIEDQTYAYSCIKHRTIGVCKKCINNLKRRKKPREVVFCKKHKTIKTNEKGICWRCTADLKRTKKVRDKRKR